MVGGEGGGRWLGGFDRQILRAPLVSGLVRRRLRPLVAKERSEDLVVLKELIEAGKVTPVIDRTYPLGDDLGWEAEADEGRPRSGSRARRRVLMPAVSLLGGSQPT